MTSKSTLTDVDKEIYQYLDLDKPSSFLLFAGAGSGKTRTLVNVLQEIRSKQIQKFVRNGQRIAIITYTNAACEEIKHRLQYDPMFSVSTIHSFVWMLIQPFTQDIKTWLEKKLKADIQDLKGKIERARTETSKETHRKSHGSKKKRLIELNKITSFIYSPASNRIEKGSLNHSEVISIGAEFIANQPLMQNVLVNRFPILLIDESQDTNKALLEAFIVTQQHHRSRFALGLFGDLMQRIYSGGKEDLDRTLPDDWKKPAKIVNYRCPRRVVELINKIRIEDDGKQQIAKENAEEGVVRLFIVNASNGNKFSVEERIRKNMLAITTDCKWQDPSDVKVLTLEHAMAAERGNFSEFFNPLSAVDSLRDSILNGTSSTIKFITGQLLPFIESVLANDNFEVARIIKKYSELIHINNPDFIQNPIRVLNDTDQAVTKFRELLVGEHVKLKFVLDFIKQENLLLLPDNLKVLLGNVTEEIMDDIELTPKQLAWSQALEARLSHVDNYAKYISEELGFTTHQGVKGLEFDRVMAVMDDQSSKGFLFKYEKLFGVVALTKTDRSNEEQGKDSVISRTRRLFYVICSRAERSLAVVIYSQDPQLVRQNVMTSNWFNDDEIIML